MDYEKEINDIKRQLSNLQNSFLQAQRNNISTVERVDDTSNKVAILTPYTEAKVAGIDDTLCEFDFREGNITAWLSNHKPCEVEVIEDKIVVTFEPLEEVTTVNIQINQ